MIYNKYIFDFYITDQNINQLKNEVLISFYLPKKIDYQLF